MLKKIFIQIFLIIIIILILFLFYIKYIAKNDQIYKIEKVKEDAIKSEDIKGNVISDISYESQDFQGRKYLIKSHKGIVNKNNPNIIEMEKVNAKITLIDGSSITIVSDYAVYDNIRFDTKFSKDIEVKHLEHIIKSDNLVLSFEGNQLEAFNNLTYENLDLIMFADKIIFNLKSKNTKIFNFDNSNVKIQNK